MPLPGFGFGFGFGPVEPGEPRSTAKRTLPSTQPSTIMPRAHAYLHLQVHGVSVALILGVIARRGVGPQRRRQRPAWTWTWARHGDGRRVRVRGRLEAFAITPPVPGEPLEATRGPGTYYMLVDETTGQLATPIVN